MHWAHASFLVAESNGIFSDLVLLLSWHHFDMEDGQASAGKGREGHGLWLGLHLRACAYGPR